MHLTTCEPGGTKATHGLNTRAHARDAHIARRRVRKGERITQAPNEVPNEVPREILISRVLAYVVMYLNL